MAKDRDNLADGFTDSSGGWLSGFLAEEDDLDRRSLWRLGSWGVGSVAAVVVAVHGQPIVDRRAPRPDCIRRPGAAVTADPVGGQGKPRRGPAAGVRHRHPERRPRPAVLARHRPRAGSGQRHRLDRAPKFCRGFAASRPIRVRRTGTAIGFPGSAAGCCRACDHGRRAHRETARPCRASARVRCAGPVGDKGKGACRDAGNAAGGVPIDDGAA